MQKLKSFTFVILFGIAALGLTPSPAQSALLLVNGSGQLTGAQNVDVSGTLFDVTLVDGTCIALFAGCDAILDFDFITPATADAAAAALLDQVFINSGAGNFDTFPSLTFGCGNAIVCSAAIPFEFPVAGAVRSATAINFDPSFANDNTGILTTAPSTDFAISNTIVYASFALSPIGVPEPSTLLLFGVGLAGLAGFARRRRQA